MDNKTNAGLQYALDYRDVKHPRLEFKTGTLQIILPNSYQNEKHTLEKYQNWIRRKENIIKNYLTQMPQEHLIPESGACVINGVIIEIDPKTKKAVKIERVDREVEIT